MASYCHRLRWRYIRARRCSHCGVGAALDELLHHTTTTWSTSVRRRSYFCLYLYYYTHYAALGCATCMNAAAAVCLSTTSSICAYINTSFKMPTSPVSRCATYDLAVDGAVRGACERCTLDLSHQLITRGKLPPDRARRGHGALLVMRLPTWTRGATCDTCLAPSARIAAAARGGSRPCMHCGSCQLADIAHRAGLGPL